MKDIGDLLTQSLKRHGIERQVKTVRVVEAARALLLRGLSSSAQSDVHVVSFFGNRLRVACKHPIAAQEIQRVQKSLIAGLTALFPDATIYGVDILIDERMFREMQMI